MKRLHPCLFGLGLVAVFSVCLAGLARADFTDTFLGPTLDSNWSTLQVGPNGGGQIAVSNGLSFTGNLGLEGTVLVSTPTFSNVNVVLSFSNFTSTTTGSAFPFPPSGVGLALGPSTNAVSVGLADQDGTLFLGALQIDFLTAGTISNVTTLSTTLNPATPTSGQLEISYVGSEVSVLYNLGAGWQLLASFSPGWGGSEPIYITTANNPDGVTSFTVDSVTASSTSLLQGAVTNLQALSATIGQRIPPISFKNQNAKNTMLNKLNSVINSIDAGNYQDALDQLDEILAKTSGCVNANPPTPSKADWVISCAAQNSIYPFILGDIQLVEDLMK